MVANAYYSLISHIFRAVVLHTQVYLQQTFHEAHTEYQILDLCSFTD